MPQLKVEGGAFAHRALDLGYDSSTDVQLVSVGYRLVATDYCYSIIKLDTRQSVASAGRRYL